MGDKTPSTPSTPGSRAIENLRSQEKVLQLFKTPTEIVQKKKKPKILTEEKYIEELANIIQRDFFPHLEKLRAQNDYLDAEARKDYAQMEIIRARYSGRRPSERSRSMTPATFETPSSMANATPAAAALGSDTPKSTISNLSSVSQIEGGPPKKSIGDKHSLDSFLQSYTSEDNQSFQEIIETADEKLRQKFAILYNEEKISAAKLARALTLPSIEKQFEEPDPMRAIETWNYTNKNSIMYIPDGVELTDTERIEAVNFRQVIKHDATRLAHNPFNESDNQKTVAELAKSQNQVLSEKLGVDGNPLNAKKLPAPQVRGFELLATPSPRPGDDFSPLMTWGEIEGTPFRLDGSDTPVRSNAGPSFRITETSRRENIGLQLAEKAGEKMRAQKQRALDAARKNMSSPFIRSNMERLASMSPAARRLASRSTGISSRLLTPTPVLSTPALVARTTPKVGSGIGVVKKTAKGNNQNVSSGVNSSDTRTRPATQDIDLSTSTLTDDLLKIPTKRLKAADFF